MNGLQAIRELRSRGYTGAIAVMSGSTEANHAKRCLEAGADHYMSKPVSDATLEAMLGTLDEEPVFSSRGDAAELSDFILSFVESLPERIRALESALVTDDLETLGSVSRALQGEAQKVGFDVIFRQGAAVVEDIATRKSLSDLRNDAHNLIRLCMRARASRAAKPS
jgi:YesN/AraC family two-component response regulator